MIEQKVNQSTSTQHETTEVEKGFLSDGVLSIGGTFFSTIGKIALAVGVSGLLMYAFYQLEMIIGIGAVYTGAAAVCTGLVSMIIGNKFSTGSFLDGLLEA